MEVDNDPDPAWLDVDGLAAAVTAAMMAAPDDEWRIRIVARPRRTLAASVPVPALGWSAVRAVEGDGPIADPVHADDQSLDNGLVRVTVAEDGTLEVATPDGVVASGVGRIVDGGDFGDSYNYGPPATDSIVEAPRVVTTELELEGPVVGRLVIHRTYDWPRGLTPDGAARTGDTEQTETSMRVELHAGEPFVRIELAFENRSDDHRVRFHAPLPRPASASFAEGQFAVVERGLTAEGGYREEPLATFPAHGWVDAGGLAVLLDHVVEYELVGGGAEIALTLLRSTGLISRNANPYRQDPAGPELAIPDAQMRGGWRIGFALLPHPGSWQDGGVGAAAERYRHPLTWAYGSGGPKTSWPPPRAGDEGLAVDGDGLDLSALRRRDDGWLELRIVNLAADARRAVVRGGLTEAREASLRGEPGEAIAVADGAIALELGPAEIRTVQVRRTETGAPRASVLDASGPRQNA
jgi:alpha-mannosidase